MTRRPATTEDIRNGAIVYKSKAKGAMAWRVWAHTDDLMAVWVVKSTTTTPTAGCPLGTLNLFVEA